MTSFSGIVLIFVFVYGAVGQDAALETAQLTAQIESPNDVAIDPTVTSPDFGLDTILELVSNTLSQNGSTFGNLLKYVDNLLPDNAAYERTPTVNGETSTGAPQVLADIGFSNLLTIMETVGKFKNVLSSNSLMDAIPMILDLGIDTLSNMMPELAKNELTTELLPNLVNYVVDNLLMDDKMLDFIPALLGNSTLQESSVKVITNLLPMAIDFGIGHLSNYIDPSFLNGMVSKIYSIVNAYTEPGNPLKGGTEMLANVVDFKSIIRWASQIVLNRMNILTQSTSLECKRDVAEFVTSLLSFKNSWGLQMLDAYGKVPAGVLLGNFFWAGDFHQCVNIKVFDEPNGQTKHPRFVGEHCMLKLNIELDKDKTAWNALIKQTNFLGFLYGVCLPSSCTLEDKTEIFKNIIHPFRFVVYKEFCQTAETESMDSVATILTLILLIPVILVAVATAYEYFTNKTPANGNNKGVIESNNVKSVASRKGEFRKTFCHVFDARNSYNSLFNSAGDITCLYGIRFIFMLIVIWVHLFTLRTMEIPWKNPMDYHKVMDNPLLHVSAQSFSMMGIFFIMSGFCLTYTSLLGASKNNENFSIVRCYINRYIRIITVYIFVATFNAGPFALMGKGPLWPQINTMKNSCRKHWLRRFLNLENVFHRVTQDFDCVTGEWFLGVDWQLYLLGVPLVWLMIRKPRHSFILISALIGTVTVLITFIVSFSKNAHVFYSIATEDESGDIVGREDNDFTFSIYLEFWSRIPSFGIGMLSGYLLVRKGNTPGTVSRAVYLGGWCLFWITLALLEGYGYFYFRVPEIPKVLEAFYAIFGNIMWPSAWCWYIFHCAQFPTGLANRIMSIRPFVILGKLTFGMYLVHQTIMYWQYSRFPEPQILSYETKVWEFFQISFLSIVASFCTYFLVESPTERLLKMMKKPTYAQIKQSDS